MTSFIVYTQKTLLVNGYPYVSKANKYVCTDAMYTYLPTNLPTYLPTYLPTNLPTYLHTYLLIENSMAQILPGHTN